MYCNAICNLVDAVGNGEDDLFVDDLFVHEMRSRARFKV